MANALTAVRAKPNAGIKLRAGEVPGVLPGAVMIVFMCDHLARGFSMGRVSI
jgi:hypothetical protein